MGHPTPLAAGALVGARYRLEREVEDCGLGEVRLATDTRLASGEVLVKLLGPAPRDQVAMLRFRSHGETLRKLGDAHVAPVLGYGEAEGRLYLVMEHAEGRSLANWLDGHRDAGTRPALGVVQRLFDRLCAGVQVAHGDGTTGAVVHGCLTPASALLRRLPSGDHRVVVMDFGLGAFEAVAGHVGAVPGRWEYLAPEQETAPAGVVASDVFALAVILVEMLTTQALPRRDTGRAWRHAALEGRAHVRALLDASREEVPGAVWDELAVALSAAPGERQRDARHLRSALRQAWRSADAWDESSAVEPDPPPARPRARPPAVAPSARAAGRPPGGAAPPPAPAARATPGVAAVVPVAASTLTAPSPVPPARVPAQGPPVVPGHTMAGGPGTLRYDPTDAARALAPGAWVGPSAAVPAPEMATLVDPVPQGPATWGGSEHFAHPAAALVSEEPATLALPDGARAQPRGGSPAPVGREGGTLAYEPGAGPADARPGWLPADPPEPETVYRDPGRGGTSPRAVSGPPAAPLPAGDRPGAKASVERGASSVAGQGSLVLRTVLLGVGMLLVLVLGVALAMWLHSAGARNQSWGGPRRARSGVAS